MGLKGLLEKMKLVESEETPMESPTTETPRVVVPPPRKPVSSGPLPSMSEVIRRAPAPTLDEKAVATGGDIPDFPAIYKASGIKDPAHGFTAYKVLEILSSPDFEALEGKAKAAALSGFLRMNPLGPVAIADIVQDAVARDGALDNFEGFLKSKLDAKRGEKDKENAALDELTRRNREKMQANQDAMAKDQELFATWQARKRIEEHKLFEAIAPFVENNPVSVGAASAAATTTPSAAKE
jgi:hypothetical protein